MKNILAVLLVLLLVTSIALARPGDMTFGPKFVLNFATLSGDGSSSISSSTKFGIGGFITYNLLEQLTLQGELLYNRKGCSYSTTPTSTATGSYFDFVALAKYPIQVKGDISPFVFAGPSLGFLLSASVEQGGQTQDYSSVTSGADFALIFGAGATYKLGNGGIVFDLRYYLGLSNVHKNSPPSNSNQIFSMNFGYAFM